LSANGSKMLLPLLGPFMSPNSWSVLPRWTWVSCGPGIVCVVY
jgi:hypothetical protein